MQWGHICLRLWPAVLGRDDSLLQDGDAVYVVDHIQFDLPGPIQKIDYFHGLCYFETHQMPIAQMISQKEDVPACQMISLNGCFAKAVRVIQRSFKSKRVRRLLQAHRLLPRPIGDVQGIACAIAGYV